MIAVLNCTASVHCKHGIYIFFYILSRTNPILINIGPQIRLIRTIYLFIMDHLLFWQNHPDGKLVIIASQLVLQKLMAKFCRAIRPPCGANEPPPTETSLCRDTDFTQDITKLQQLVVLLRHKVVQLHHKSHFVIQLDRFPI